MIYDVGHVFICLFAMLLSLVKYLEGFCPIFKLSCAFSNCWILRVLCIFWITVLYQLCVLQIFSPNLQLVFPFSWHCLLQSRSFHFNFSGVSYQVFLSWIVPLLYLKTHYETQGHLNFLPCYLLETLYFCALLLGLWSILSWFLWRV